MTDKGTASPAVRSLADVAVDENGLFRDGYVKGAAEFIKECATPMTIAIQGGSGAGKSSLINLIEKKLRAEGKPAEEGDPDAAKYCDEIISVVTVDVWQQSVANPHANLFEVLLSEMVLNLSGSDMAEMRGFSEFTSVASKVVGAVAIGEASSKEDSPLGSILNLVFDSDEESKSDSGDDYVSSEDLATLKTSLGESLRQLAKDTCKTEDSRYVIFVDGLDHINAETAVELMERIKAYIDCPRCVYVLAVDEQTVLDGSKEKLGEKAEESRKKMLFDRLVQVPLRIPASAYNMEKYIEGLLEDEQELRGEFANVLNVLLTEPTPRCVKRYVNTLSLYRSVLGGLEGEEGASLAMLLAAVILEVESTRGFDAIASCARGDEAHFAEKLEAALASSEFGDRVDWAKLPALWRGGGGEGVDAAKRDAFISWVRKLK